MYFLIACNDEPPRSFNDLIALQTISAVGGRFGFARGAFAEAAAAAFFVVFLTGVATVSVVVAAGVAATSDIINYV